MFEDLSSIKTRRLRLGLKQNQLAELANVSQSLIAKLEKSKLEPSYSIAIKIFQTLESLEHKKEKKCSEVMTTKVLGVKPNDKISKVSEIMKKHSVDQLPVIRGHQVVGSISESLIFTKMLEEDKKELLDMKVEKIMSNPYPMVNTDMPLSSILPMLKTEDAILVSENRKIVGIITKNNLI